MRITLPWLEEPHQPFPATDTALEEPNGLLCAGGDLSRERLLTAYSNGIFPWYEDDQPILWWSPDPRCILEFDRLHVSRSMQRLLHKNAFRFTFDTDFPRVVRACAAPRAYCDSTWITDDMLRAYTDLHSQGFAHSIEVWSRDELVGGLYGVCIGRCFFGESMFSKATNASKAAFIVLARHLKHWQFRCMDCQVTNQHLLTLGAREVPRAAFLSILRANVQLSPFAAWHIVDELAH